MSESPHGRWTVVGCALLLVVAGASWPRASRAQTPAADTAREDRIVGYGGVVWGADSASVTAAMGPPDTVRPVPALGARALHYTNHRLGRTRGSLGFLVSRSDGLIRVMYLTEYSGEECLDLYQHVRDTVAALFPDVPKRERMYNDAEDLPFCTAFQLAQAGARTLWNDRDTGARAWVLLDLRAGVVRVSLESPRYEPVSGDTTRVRRP